MLNACLETIHSEIKSLRDALLLNRMELDNYKEKVKLWELTEIDDIANAVDENNKPLYSNDAKRKAELERRKQCPEYTNMQKTVRDMQLEYDKRVIELQYLLDRQDNARALAQMRGVG
jgi:hypothetical protein